MCNAFVATNIPMNKSNNDVFRSFLSKYCNKIIPCESTLRKEYFGKRYEEILSKIRDAIDEQKIWVCIDGIQSYSVCHYVANNWNFISR